MNLDISPILEEWDYRLGEISVRKIMGINGRMKVQLRLDMGLLQMEIQGRPDGKKPHGRESLLDYYQSLAQEHQEGTAEVFTLSPEDCDALQMESVQYYHRRITFFQLKEYEGAKRDAEHNLQIMDLVKAYASDPGYIREFERYRPFVIAHRVQAEGFTCLRDGQVDEALRRIQNGIDEIEEFVRTSEETGVVQGAAEIEFLKNWAHEIRGKRPLSAEEKLRAALENAIQNEDFERAAQLRDKIRAMKLEKATELRDTIDAILNAKLKEKE